VQPDPDEGLIARLRAGDEQAFVALVNRHQASMLRLAASYVPSRAVAEEVVQETWVAVLHGIDGFEGRAAFRSWMFGILINKAKTSGVRERRAVPVEDPAPAVEASRFDSTGHWLSGPEQWVEAAEDRSRAAKIAARLRAALDELPARQAEVVTLRDIEELSSEQVCQLLGISEGNAGPAAPGSQQAAPYPRGRIREVAVIRARFLRRRDLVCQQAVELVTDYLEGALSGADRRRFEAHLAECPHCREYFAQIRATITLTGSVAAEDLSPNAQDDLVALFRQWRSHPEDPSHGSDPGDRG